MYIASGFVSFYHHKLQRLHFEPSFILVHTDDKLESRDKSKFIQFWKVKYS